MKRFQGIILMALLACCSFVTWAGTAPGIKKGGKFSINDSTQVRFSTGNLQYCPKEDTWRFAENQYDILGDENTNAGLPYFEAYLDLFGWGATGYEGVKPYSDSKNNEDYAMSGKKTDIAGTNYDWGVYCAISNGGGKPGMWRTPTLAELEYLTRQRKDGIYLWGRAKLTIAEKKTVTGTILLPDDWKLPEGITFVTAYEASQTNSNQYVHFTSNTFSLEEWQKLEEAGAIFLPYSGSRNGTNFGSTTGAYWTSTAASSKSSNAMGAFDNLISSKNIKSERNRFYGCCVRLIRDVHYFQVTYLDRNEEVLRVDSVEEFYSATPPVMKDEITESYRITYKGWNQDLTSITNDLVVKPVYTKTDRKYYTVVFFNIEGDTIRTDIVEEGNSITDTPVLKDETTEDYVLTYSGWDQNLSNIKQNLDVKPVYTKVDRSYYTVVFVDYYGDTLQTNRVEKGESITSTPALKNDTTDNYTLVYSGWEDTYLNIQSDVTVKAKYKATYKLKIAGISVTSDRCADLTGQTGVITNGKDSYLRYIPESNTLEMKNITINTTDVTWAILNNMSDLTIKISGYNKLITPNCISLRTDRSLTITGTLQDTLMMYNETEADKNAFATFAAFNSSSVTINSCAVVCTGACGIQVKDLTLRNAYVYAESFGTPPSDSHKKVMYAFLNCSNINMVACEVAKPEKAYFSSTLGGFTSDGSTLLREVEIVPEGLPLTVTYMNGETVVRIDTFYQGEKVLKKEPTMSSSKREDGMVDVFEGWDKSVYGKMIAEDVVINAEWSVGYDLIIQGVRVTEENRTNILAEQNSAWNLWAQQKCESGLDEYCDKKREATVSYEPTTNVLSIAVKETSADYHVMDNWSSEQGLLFYNGIPDLTIHVNGNLALVAYHGPAFHSTTSVTFEGEGPEQTEIYMSSLLNAEKVEELGEFAQLGDWNYAGIIAEDKISFKNCSVIIEAAVGCEAKELELTNTSFSVGDNNHEPKLPLQDEKKHSLKCSSLTLNNEEIIEPAGAYFDSALKGITLDGTSLTREKVVIAYKALSDTTIGADTTITVVPDTTPVIVPDTTPSIITGLENAVNLLPLYPNPADEYVVVPDGDHSDVAVYNTLGCKILAAKVENGRVDVRSLVDGLYILRVEDKTYRFYVRRR